MSAGWRARMSSPAWKYARRFRGRCSSRSWRLACARLSWSSIRSRWRGSNGDWPSQSSALTWRSRWRCRLRGSLSSASTPSLTSVSHSDITTVSQWLEKQVESHWDTVVISECETEVRLGVDALLKLPLSLQRHLLRQVSALLCEGQSPLEPRHLLLIEDQLSLAQASRQERELHLPMNLRAYFQAGELILARQPADMKQVSAHSHQFTSAGEVYLPIPGEARVPGTPWIARVERIPQELEDSLAGALRQESWPAVWSLLEPPTPHAVYIDASTAGTHLLVRTRRPGDRIQPLGMMTEKKIKDIFIDSHFTRSVRATTPLFFAGSHCLWVAGACLDHRARLTSQTRSVLRLSVSYTPE